MDSASPPLSSIVSHEELCQFHTIDRLLYSILVIHLYRDPVEAMQLLAMWLWMEQVGYRHLVKKLTTLPHVLINAIADETILCIKYLKTTHFSFFSYDSYPSSEGYDISLLQSVLEKEMSLHSLYDIRDLALRGVEKIMHTVCVKVFSEIMKQAITRNTIERMVEAQRQIQAELYAYAQLHQQQQQQQFRFGPIEPSYLQIDQNSELQQQHHQQQPIRFGSIEHSNMQYANMVQGVALDNQIWMQNHLAQENNNGEQVPRDERTLFLTFSKGFRVQEWEVKEFFTTQFGDNVEGLYMQEVEPREQPLYARIVFRSAAIIDTIINGLEKVKFSINGKHVWARKFLPKRSRTVIHMPTNYNNYNIGESSGTAGMS